ncbi:MAG: alanine/ornithine racemase family PLP-dependent enzyme [Pseudomonadota bacterium]
MTFPCLNIDLDKIEHNARIITGLCRDHGIAVTGVTKVTCGNPQVAAAMLRGGVIGIADSRLENIRRLRDAGIPGPRMLLRIPPLSGVDTVVQAADISLNTEPAVLEGLSEAAQRHGRLHEVILMVELGELREGIPPDELLPLVEETLKLAGIRIVGLGTNLACFSGVVPSAAHMQRLVDLAEAIERRFAIDLRWISGINSSGLELIASGQLPERVNHARIGEAILLGRETTHRRPWPDTFQDAFELQAEILELRRKPSRPAGELAEDAFGRQPAFENHGQILRALVNVGREDLVVEGVRTLDSRLRILGASSGYTALDVSAAEGELRVGDVLTFSVNYAALLAAMTSEYVKKQPRRAGPAATET